MESSFEETKPYVLTALGKQFAHSLMEGVVPLRRGNSGTARIDSRSGNGVGIKVAGQT